MEQTKAIKGDAILNKTIVVDCISKKTKVNEGERPMYYVENNHPAIIDKVTFARVQEEMARRTSKKRSRQVGTKTELGKYSSKYALTELLVCGECLTPYRRCTWTSHNRRRIVWRCISRTEFGTKYCHNSPTIDESVLQEAIMEAILRVAQQNTDVVPHLKEHISLGLQVNDPKDKSQKIKIRLEEIQSEFSNMLESISADSIVNFDETRMQVLVTEKAKLEKQLLDYESQQQGPQELDPRLKDIFIILDGIKNRPMEWDEVLVRQLLECVVVESKEKIKVVFKGSFEIEQQLM